MTETKRPMRTVRALRSGRITVPATFRKQLGWTEGSQFQITLEAGELRIRPLRMTEPAERGSPWLKELYEYFAPVREEIKAMGLTEDELNAEIDEAIREVREMRANASLPWEYARDGGAAGRPVRVTEGDDGGRVRGL
jgi:AbrB family looped-hinge helix DNA binding protein